MTYSASLDNNIYKSKLVSDYLQNSNNLKNFIDTKFLCEYNYYTQGLELGKCKIYYILKEEGIISENKITELFDNEKKMGPIYDIIIERLIKLSTSELYRIEIEIYNHNDKYFKDVIEN